MNACVLRSRRNEGLNFPSKVFAYLAMCANLKQNTKKVMKESVVYTSNLPFVSEITGQFTPQGAVHAHWSFLKY